MDFATLLAEGVDRWNEWRSRYPLIPCTLAGKNLSNGYFFECNLRGVDLSGANLRRACLIGADLRWADLSEADLSGAYLSEANLLGARLNNANFANANMEKITLPQSYCVNEGVAQKNLLNFSPTWIESLHHRVV